MLFVLLWPMHENIKILMRRVRSGQINRSKDDLHIEEEVLVLFVGGDGNLLEPHDGSDLNVMSSSSAPVGNT